MLKKKNWSSRADRGALKRFRKLSWVRLRATTINAVNAVMIMPLSGPFDGMSEENVKGAETSRGSMEISWVIGGSMDKVKHRKQLEFNYKQPQSCS